MEEELSNLRQRLARDVNCLVDPDRMKRRRGLKAIERTLLGKNPPADETVGVYFYENLYSTLLRLFNDEVEKNREMAITIFTTVLNKNPNLRSKVVTSVLNALEHRMGSLPFNEPAEELRLLLVELLSTLLDEDCRGAVEDSFEKVVVILTKASSDQFHDVKVACAKALLRLAKLLPSRIHMALERLVVSQVGNLGHQRSAVRKAALQAIAAIVPRGSESLKKVLNEHVFPALRKLASDRTSSVRTELAKTLAKWLELLPANLELESPLVHMLLSRVGDDVPGVAEEAVAVLDRAADTLLARREGNGGAEGKADKGSSDGELEGRIEAVLPTPFKTRPSHHARYLVQRLLPSLTPAALKDVEEWTADQRLAGSATLRALLVYAEGEIQPFLKEVLGTLCRASSDEDASVRSLIAHSARLVGVYVPAKAQLAVLLPQLQVPPQAGSFDSRPATLAVLSSVVSGLTSALVHDHVHAISATLAAPSLAETEPVELRTALVKCLGTTVEVAATSLSSCSRQSFQPNAPSVLEDMKEEDLQIKQWKSNSPVHLLLRCVVNCRIAVTSDAVLQEVDMIAQKLAENAGYASLEAAYRSEMERFVAEICDTASTWEKTSYERNAFDAFVRHASFANAEFAEAEATAFIETLTPSRAPDLRVAMIATLHHLVTSVPVPTQAGTSESKVEKDEDMDVLSLPTALKCVAEPLAIRGLIPNIVWRTGRVASTIRKVALSCLFQLFNRKLLGEDSIDSIYEEFSPLIQSTLEDEDPTTRLVVCHILSFVFQMMEQKLGEEDVRAIYPELIKRLDDSDDNVRIAMCKMLPAFTKVAPPSAFAGTPAQYMIDCLLIHMDDLEITVQEAVCEGLGAIVNIEPDYARKRLESARQEHRSPVLCDRLLSQLQLNHWNP